MNKTVVPAALDRPRFAYRERSLLGAFALSLLGHAVLVAAGVWLSSVFPRPRPQPRPQAFSLRALSPHEWEQHRGGLMPPAPPLPKGQTVDVVPGNGLSPLTSRFLAETQNRAERETRARIQVSGARAATRVSPTPHTRPTFAQRVDPPSSAPSILNSNLARFGGFGGRQPSLTDFLRPAPAAVGAGAPPVDAPNQGTETDPHAQSSQDDAPAATTTGAPPNDGIADLEEGDTTQLNTRAFKYAGYFNRVKAAVSAHWDPNGRLESNTRGQRAGFADRTTLVSVTLRADGALYDIFVSDSSGLDVLDAEAVHAFERAQPFPNPPRGLAKDGLIRFQFGFVLTHDGRFAPGTMRW